MKRSTLLLICLLVFVALVGGAAAWMYFSPGGALAPVTAEDAVQESFLRMIKNFHKIGEISCPQTKRFVVIIVRNAARNLLVKENRLRSMQDFGMSGSADDETDQPASMWENLSSGFDETPDAVLHKEILQTVQSLPD